MPHRDQNGARRSTELDPSTRDYARNATASARTTAALETRLTQCRACPRLVIRREHVAMVKRHAYRDRDYRARPVPGFGPADATVAIVVSRPPRTAGIARPHLHR
jgi:uracil-DNA glycosylase